MKILFFFAFGFVVTFSNADNTTETGERFSVIKAEAAACTPEWQVVSVDENENTDSTISYSPSCVRVKRCSGCCDYYLSSCQPTSIRAQKYEVLAKKKVKSSGELITFNKIVELEEHLACQCDCKLKEKDCNDKQRYIKTACICACTDIIEEGKCYEQSNVKSWNPNDCSCNCRKVEECSSNEKFDHESCACKPDP